MERSSNTESVVLELFEQLYNFLGILSCQFEVQDRDPI